MEKRIIKELRGKKPSEIKVLDLEYCRAKTISGLTDEFSQLTALYLVYVGLTSLDGLPKLPALHTIDLSDNKLTGGFEILVEKCPRLRIIDLCANKIKTIETLEPLKNLSELSELDLFECRVTKLPNYRKDIFTLLPQIKYLDGFDINDREDYSSDESEDDEKSFGDDKFESDYEEEVFEKKIDEKLNNFQTKLSLVENKNKEAMEILEKKMNEKTTNFRRYGGRTVVVVQPPIPPPQPQVQPVILAPVQAYTPPTSPPPYPPASPPPYPQ
uniref:Dynein assembly factor 1, axonemal homolog n=1 Tax=Meloidogyne floridensis TaxID=298350 RepID=A0A915P9J5_9BILA